MMIKQKYKANEGAKEKKNTVRCYNVIFPLWFLLFFPSVWLILLPSNFLIDSIILLLALWILKIEDKKSFYQKTILGVWAFGFIADMIGSLFLLTSQLSLGDWWQESITMPVLLNPWENFYALCFVLVALFIAAYLIYFFNYKFLFSRFPTLQNSAKRLCVILAICTAPYFFLVPTQFLYQDWNQQEGTERGDIFSKDFAVNQTNGTFFRGEADNWQRVGDIPGAQLRQINSLLYTAQETDPPAALGNAAYRIVFTPWREGESSFAVDIYLSDGQVVLAAKERYYQLAETEANNFMDMLTLLDSGELADTGWKVVHWEEAKEKQLIFSDAMGDYYLYGTDGEKTLLASPAGETYAIRQALAENHLTVQQLLDMGFDIRLQMIQKESEKPGQAETKEN